MERRGVLPTTQFADRKGLGTCNALLCLSHILQSALESGQETNIVQIDFSAAIDEVNHQGILYKLCYVGIGGSVLSILTQFLSNRSQHVMVDGCRSKLVNVVSGVPPGSVLGPLLFLLYTYTHKNLPVKTTRDRVFLFGFKRRAIACKSLGNMGVQFADLPKVLAIACI